MERLAQYDVFSVPVANIFCDDGFNCRGAFTAQSVKDLADSIATHGLQIPIVVQPWTELPYRIVAGHRRYKAVKQFLEWESIPAFIRDDLTVRQATVFNFTENLERKDLNIIQEARALRAIFPDGVSLRVAAKELKRPTRWVHIRLRLLDLPAEVQTLAETGLLSAVNIEAILESRKPIEAARAIVEHKQQHGKTKYLKVRRHFTARRSKAEITRMIAMLLDKGITGLPPRCLAWVAGSVSDREIIAEINAFARHRQKSKNRSTRTSI